MTGRSGSRPPAPSGGERAKDLVGCRVALVKRLRTDGGAVCEIGAEATVSGAWRGRYHLDVPEVGHVRMVDRGCFRVLGDPVGSDPTPPRPARSAIGGLPDPADFEVGLTSYADRAAFVREIRELVAGYPRKQRWTFTREQVQAILSVLDSLLEDDAPHVGRRLD